MTQLALKMNEVTGRRVLLWLLCAFGVISAVNLALIFFALNSFTGETQPKSYATGLDFNRTLEQVEAQRALGWIVTTEIAPQMSRDVAIKTTYRDSAGIALTGLSVVAEFTRPTTEGFDFSVSLVHAGDGHYHGVAVPPLPGQWHVRLVAEHGAATPYLLDYQVIIK